MQARIALNYHPQSFAVNKLYQTIGVDYQYRIIDPAIQESVKSVTARFTAEDLIGHRSDVNAQIRQELADRLKRSFVEVDDFNVVNFEFSSEFDRAVEAKVTAEQNALKAQRDLERIKIEAEQKIAQAKAEAESIRIQQEQLQNNPEILRLRTIEKWDGRLPVVVGEGPTPFIDVTGLVDNQ